MDKKAKQQLEDLKVKLFNAHADRDFSAIHSVHKAAEAGKVRRCSACGSTAPHHVQYVEDHGVCIV